MPNIKVRRAFYREIVVHVTQEMYESGDYEREATMKASLAPDSAWAEWGFDRDEDQYRGTDEDSYDGLPSEEEEQEDEDEDEEESCRRCHNRIEGGEGYDGLCGNCADLYFGGDEDGEDNGQ